jgi:hypothetical protein
LLIVTTILEVLVFSDAELMEAILANFILKIDVGIIPNPGEDFDLSPKVCFTWCSRKEKF